VAGAPVADGWKDNRWVRIWVGTQEGDGLAWLLSEAATARDGQGGLRRGVSCSLAASGPSTTRSLAVALATLSSPCTGASPTLIEQAIISWASCFHQLFGIRHLLYSIRGCAKLCKTMTKISIRISCLKG
jgi:hypothetical protein